MKRAFLILTSALLLAAATAAPTSAATVLMPSEWVPEYGDQLFVDVSANMGYLLHRDARYMPFKVATGLQRTIYYNHTLYYAQTPAAFWVAKDRVIQLDNVNFGPTRRFFRLYRNGDTRTAYGIHGHKSIEEWLKSPMRYRSYGCIVVAEETLDIIERTYALNDNSLIVTTMLGSDKFLQELAARETPRYTF